MSDNQKDDEQVSPAPPPPPAVEMPDIAVHQAPSNEQPNISDQTLVDRIDRSDRWMIFLTGTIAVTGVISAVIFGYQLSEMRAARIDGDQSTAAQLSLMKAQSDAMQGQLHQLKAAAAQTARAIAATNELAREASKSADQSRRLVAVTDQASKMNQSAVSGTQRAFVAAAGPTFRAFDPIDDKSLWFMGFKLRNSGNTPTVDMRVTYRCLPATQFVGNPEDATKVDIPFESAQFVSGKYTLAPKEEMDATYCALYERKHVINIDLPPAYTFYVYGKAVYRDTFNRNAAHITEFCYETTVITSEPSFNSKSERGWLNVTSPCLAYNCADEECSEADRQKAASDLGITLTPTGEETPPPKRQRASHER